MRIAEDAIAPRVRVGGYVRVDPGRGETVVRLLTERDGRRLMRALDERCPEHTVDAGGRKSPVPTRVPKALKVLPSI